MTELAQIRTLLAQIEALDDPLRWAGRRAGNQQAWADEQVYSDAADALDAAAHLLTKTLEDLEANELHALGAC